MNGELYQICCIVSAGRGALRSGRPIRYVPLKYDGKITFVCLPQKRMRRKKEYTAPNVETWFAYLKGRRLRDMMLFCPTTAENRERLGFANMTESSIVCFFEDGAASFFVGEHRFDPGSNLWETVYTEREYTAPPTKPRFGDNTESFRHALAEIRDLARRLGGDTGSFRFFEKTFESAADILDGGGDCPQQKDGFPRPILPERNLRIFEAACQADVFGAMGSWNDNPAYMAHEMKVAEEYTRISDELLKNIREALLYAVNEW